MNKLKNPITNELKSKIDKIEKETKNYILIFDDTKNNEIYKNDMAKNLALIMNKEKYKTYFIDVVKYKDQFKELYNFEIENYPFILKVENEILVKAWDKIILGL